VDPSVLVWGIKIQVEVEMRLIYVGAFLSVVVPCLRARFAERWLQASGMNCMVEAVRVIMVEAPEEWRCVVRDRQVSDDHLSNHLIGATWLTQQSIGR
jgi:hypothetical protein